VNLENSLDWPSISKELLSQLNAIDYNPDLRKMYKNIENMVSELSKLEVEARRTHILHYAQSKLDEVNKSIDHLAKLLLMAKLMN